MTEVNQVLKEIETSTTNFEIDLTNQKISLSDVEKIGQAIAKKPNIKLCDFSNSNFDDEKAISFLKSLKKNTNMLEVLLDECNISKNIKDEIERHTYLNKILDVQPKTEIKPLSLNRYKRMDIVSRNPTTSDYENSLGKSRQ